jgi:CDP-diacylglycerol--serine O-phosphatidyltransferase
MSDLFPPFVPDPPEKTRRRSFKSVPFRVIAPNLITLLALCLGLTAIRLAFEGRLEPAIVAIFFAALLDGVDGRVARMLKGTSRFGAELDSLSDFVNFGVAPALILYSFILHHLKALGWIAALIFAIASCLRLARFNVMLDDPNRPDWKRDFFVGMPAPMGAITALLPIYLHFVGVPMGAGLAPVAAIYVLAMAILMVSTVPTYSGKTVGKRIPRSYVLPIFVGAVALVALMASFPFEVLAIGTIAYLALIPVGVARYRQLDRQHLAATTADEPPDAPGVA